MHFEIILTVHSNYIDCCEKFEKIHTLFMNVRFAADLFIQTLITKNYFLNITKLIEKYIYGIICNNSKKAYDFL